MGIKIIFKKLDQIKELLNELEDFLDKPLKEFIKNFIVIRASERNFQLIVDLASDINVQIIAESGKQTPDTYKQSFLYLEKAGILENKLTVKLVLTAKLRNILVHEYDFEEDYEKFYKAAKDAIPAYKEYIKKIYGYIKDKNDKK